MKISIHGDHIKVTEAIKNYIEEKITKVGKYFGNPEEIEAVVKIRVRGINQIIEVTIPTKSFTIRAEETNEDLYSAIDLVEKKLETQIKKNKSKIASRYKEKNSFIVVDEDTTLKLPDLPSSYTSYYYNSDVEKSGRLL